MDEWGCCCRLRMSRRHLLTWVVIRQRLVDVALLPRALQRERHHCFWEVEPELVRHPCCNSRCAPIGAGIVRELPFGTPSGNITRLERSPSKLHGSCASPAEPSVAAATERRPNHVRAPPAARLLLLLLLSPISRSSAGARRPRRPPWHGAGVDATVSLTSFTSPE